MQRSEISYLLGISYRWNSNSILRKTNQYRRRKNINELAWIVYVPYNPGSPYSDSEEHVCNSIHHKQLMNNSHWGICKKRYNCRPHWMWLSDNLFHGTFHMWVLRENANRYNLSEHKQRRSTKTRLRRQESKLFS